MADNVRHVQVSPISLLLIIAAFQMWLQAIAIVLPRVQDQYSSLLIPLPTSFPVIDKPFFDLVPDGRIGALSSSMFAGMMFGAVGWGTCEWPGQWRSGVLILTIHYPGTDLLGRSMAFNGTLLFTSLFGLGATITTSFWTLCVALFLLGSAVGVRVSRLCLSTRGKLKGCIGIDAN